MILWLYKYYNQTSGMMAQEIQLDFLSEMISHGWYLKINLVWLPGNYGYS